MDRKRKRTIDDFNEKNSDKKAKTEFFELICDVAREIQKDPQRFIERLIENDKWDKVEEVIAILSKDQLIQVCEVFGAIKFDQPTKIRLLKILQSRNRTVYVKNEEGGYTTEVDEQKSIMLLKSGGLGGFDNTILMYACENLEVDVVKTLLENGCNVNDFDSFDMTALMHVHYIITYDVSIEYIRKRLREESPETRSKKREIINLLLAAGIDEAWTIGDDSDLKDIYKNKTAAEIMAIIRGHDKPGTGAERYLI